MAIDDKTALTVSTEVSDPFTDVNTVRSGINSLLNQIDADEDKLSDIDATDLTKLNDINVTAERINQLTGITATATEINAFADVTADADELSVLSDLTATATEINKLDDLSITNTEYSYLSGLSENVQDAIDNAGSGETNHVALYNFAEDTITADDLGELTIFIRTSNKTYTLETEGIDEGAMIMAYSTFGTSTSFNTTDEDGDNDNIRINNTFRFFYIIRRGNGWVLEGSDLA